MRRHFKAFLLGVAIAATSPVASARADCGKGQPAFEDTFQTLDPGWGGGSTLSVANNALIIAPPAGYVHYALSQSDYYGDGSICVLAAIAEASAIDSVQALVLFWGVDYDNLYELNIGSDGKTGYYKIERISKGKSLTPVDWTSDPAIKFNIGDQNQIEVRLAGRAATFIVNGKTLTTIHGNPPDGGGLIGLGGGLNDGVTGKFAFQKFQFFNAAAP